MAFRIPLIVKMEMPNPSPLSSNCDVVKVWAGGSNGTPINAVSMPANNVNMSNNIMSTNTDNFINMAMNLGENNKFDDSFVISNKPSEKEEPD